MVRCWHQPAIKNWRQGTVLGDLHGDRNTTLHRVGLYDRRRSTDPASVIQWMGAIVKLYTDRHSAGASTLIIYLWHFRCTRRLERQDPPFALWRPSGLLACLRVDEDGQPERTSHQSVPKRSGCGAANANLARGRETYSQRRASDSPDADSPGGS